MIPIPADIFARVAAARTLLVESQFRLDYRGMECAALADLAGDAAALLSEWQGRKGNSASTQNLDEPAYIVAAAIAWRAERDRRTRR